MTKRTSLTPIRVMKSVSIFAALTAFVAEVSSHYTFPGLILGGVTSSDWQYVRQTNNYQSLNPVTDVTTDDIRCYTSMESGTAPSTATVAAGSTIGFSVPITMYHDSVVNVYMAQAPAGTDVASWDGSGEVWFKVYEIPAIANGVTIEFPATPQATVVFTVPSELPSGQYLIRVENIALHVAQTFGGAQFYIGCAQVDITNGGNGTPGPLVAFPGAYTGNEPGILINIYFPIPTTYIQPGPPVWPASGSSGPTSSTSTIVKTTSSSSTVIKTTPPVSTKTTVSTSSTKASSTTTSTGPTNTGVAEFGQCGGQGFTGATTCQSPFVCTVLNPYYSQCT